MPFMTAHFWKRRFGDDDAGGVLRRIDGALRSAVERVSGELFSLVGFALVPKPSDGFVRETIEFVHVLRPVGESNRLTASSFRTISFLLPARASVFAAAFAMPKSTTFTWPS